MGSRWAEFSLGLGPLFGVSNPGGPFPWGDKDIFI